jgi:hypothetical protein
MSDTPARLGHPLDVLRTNPWPFLAATLLGAGLAWLLAWAIRPPAPKAQLESLESTIALNEAQLTAFRQYAMSFGQRLAGVRSVDVPGQFASVTIHFHPSPTPLEMFASTNIRRWTYVYSEVQLSHGYFLFLVFEEPLHDFKVQVLQDGESMPWHVEDATPRTLLLKFLGEPAERSVTIDVLPR